jgi:hypothetical protein
MFIKLNKKLMNRSDVSFIKNNLNSLMRFKIKGIQASQKHEDMCTSVSWCSFNELTR